MNNKLKQKLYDITDTMQKADTLRYYKNRLQIVSNLLKSSRDKDVKARWDFVDNGYTIEEISASIYPDPKLWNQVVTLRYEPKEYYSDLGRLGLELDIGDYTTLTNHEEIISFLKRIKWDDMLEGVDE